MHTQQILTTIARVFPDLDPSLTASLENRLVTFFEQAEKNAEDVSLTTERQAELISVFLFSEYAASAFTRNPALFRDLTESGDLDATYAPQTYETRLRAALSGLERDTAAVKPILLETKLRETVRIAWRDLTRKAGLEETLEDLSRLADSIVSAAVTAVYSQAAETHGLPEDDAGLAQDLIVLGMGKLGARELNFSSDIDLIFVYPEEGSTNGERSISNHEFFTKVCRNFTRLFSNTGHGFNFYRLDTRLRPFGDGGPLVMGAQAFEEYYQAQGRDWERYAMIKARPIAGDIRAGNALLKSLNAFIYRRYFDYNSFDAFRDMKQRIALQVKNKKLKNNIKLGAGGIREIEFFGQLFQLIRGGVEPRLQERRILKVLDLLRTARCIDTATRDDLKQAYVFLRQVENRLQACADLQTHDIPEKAEARVILARSMGYRQWDAFKPDLDRHLSRVHHHFNQLLVSGDGEERDQTIEDLTRMWNNVNDPQFKADAIQIGNFEDPAKVLSLMRTLEAHPNTKRLTPNGRKKLARLLPLLIKKISEQEAPDDVLVKLMDLVVTIQRRTTYLSLLVENSRALENLITLARKSPWIISFLSGHPALLDELMHPATLYSPPGREALEQEMADRMAGLSAPDLEILLEELCIFKQVNLLRVAAADVSGDYPLMKVSDHLTWIAETVLNQVLAICWDIVVKKYGLPATIGENGLEDCGFAVVAYGKVGGFEMGYKSDIDCVFLHRAEPGMTSGPGRQVDTTSFYANLGQRIIHSLTMHTPAGTLYGADMRLRPGGDSGMIVSHIDGFEAYMEKDAWTWEHQALIRARPVAGDARICQDFQQIRKRILTRKRPGDTLKKEVGEMREKMRAQRLKPEKGTVDLKQSKGGIVDIEFLVQYLILNHACQYRDLAVWTDNIRLLESLDTEGIIPAEHSERLQKAYVTMRKAIHHQNLQEKNMETPEALFQAERSHVASLYDHYVGSLSPDNP